jgi:hypothetical protein
VQISLSERRLLKFGVSFLVPDTQTNAMAIVRMIRQNVPPLQKAESALEMDPLEGREWAKVL